MLQTEKKRTPYRDTKRLKAVERRALILRAAQSILLDEGFAALTMRNTAEAAEIRIATLQYYFVSREKLFEAAFKDIANKAWIKVMSRLDQANELDPQSRLCFFVRAMCESSRNESLVGFFIELWAAARVHQYASDIMAIYYKDAVTILGKLIHEAKPEFERQRSRQLATLAISLIEGHSLFNQMEQFAKRKTNISISTLEKTIMVLLND